MRALTIAGLGVLALSMSMASQGVAQPTEQSKSCSERAAQQGLTGKDRDSFNATCMKGSLTPKAPTSPTPQTAAAKALTAPSGEDRTDRSKTCNAEAARRGLKEGALQAFRKGCLASAAPAGTIQTSKQTEGPTKEKPKLDALIDAPRR